MNRFSVIFILILVIGGFWFFAKEKSLKDSKDLIVANQLNINNEIKESKPLNQKSSKRIPSGMKWGFTLSREILDKNPFFILFSKLMRWDELKVSDLIRIYGFVFPDGELEFHLEFREQGNQVKENLILWVKKVFPECKWYENKGFLFQQGTSHNDISGKIQCRMNQKIIEAGIKNYLQGNTREILVENQIIKALELSSHNGISCKSEGKYYFSIETNEPVCTFHGGEKLHEKNLMQSGNLMVVTCQNNQIRICPEKFLQATESKRLISEFFDNSIPSAGVFFLENKDFLSFWLKEENTIQFDISSRVQLNPVIPFPKLQDTMRNLSKYSVYKNIYQGFQKMLLGNTGEIKLDPETWNVFEQEKKNFEIQNSLNYCKSNRQKILPLMMNYLNICKTKKYSPLIQMNSIISKDKKWSEDMGKVFQIMGNPGVINSPLFCPDGGDYFFEYPVIKCRKHP